MSDLRYPVQKTEDQWRRTLDEEQFRVLRLKGTELPFSGKYVTQKDDGSYQCAGCGAVLFSSKTQYDSGCGWPSFWDSVYPNSVKLQEDTSHGMIRTEVVCSNCGSHLGHVFEDGPQDKTGKRYCINSVALNFRRKQK